MRAAQGLLEHLIDEAELRQALRGEAHRIRSGLLLLGALPQDRGAALRRDHRIGAVLKHQQAVAHADRERAARAALADDDRNDRNAQHRHLKEIARDRLALAALLGADARVRARGIDEGDERQAEALRETHQTQRLAIALGLGHAVVAAHALLGIAALLMAEHHDRAVAQARKPADDRKIIAKHAIAVQLLELAAHDVHVIERVGAVRVTRELRDLPGREIGEDVRRQLPALRLQSRDLLADIDFRVIGS